MQDFFDDLEQLQSRTRFMSHNGFNFELECRDPYGFWFVTVKGMKKTPEVLDQSFTTIFECQRSCRIWAEAQGKVPAEDVKEEVESPVAPIRRKKIRPDAK